MPKDRSTSTRPPATAVRRLPPAGARQISSPAQQTSGFNARGAQANPAALTPADVVWLQRAVGNRAVGQLAAGRQDDIENTGGAGAVVPEATIQRKLSGARAALEGMGDKASLQSQGKALATKVQKSNTSKGSGKYAQLLSDLNSYEKLEAELIKKARPLEIKEERSLLDRLAELEKVAEAWIEQNLAAVQNPAAVKQVLLGGKNVDELEQAETKNQRRAHAIKLLLVRLRHERWEILHHRFHETGAWSDKTLDPGQTRDDAFGGAVNRLDQVAHRGADRPGVFIWDRSWEGSGTAGKDLGIPDVDPMAGARSVAMYQLARLLNFDINVIAPTDFATHTSATKQRNAPLRKPAAKFGVRMEMAAGREAAETPTAQTAAERGPGQISLEDPFLQRALNALQLIDAIAGQLDRHWHNYYIAKDAAGNVTGVVGIDLDMAFAMEHRGVEPTPVDMRGRPVTKSNFVGLPGLVDDRFATAIRAVPEDELRHMLRTYLAPAEVESTLIRFHLVKDACVRIQSEHRTVTEWNANTAAQQQDPATSYLGKMQEGLLGPQFTGPATQTVRNLFDRNGIGQDNDVRAALPEIINGIVNAIKDKRLRIPDANHLLDELQARFDRSPSIQASLAQLGQMRERGEQRAGPIRQRLAEVKQAKQGQRMGTPAYAALQLEYERLTAESVAAGEGNPNFKKEIRDDLLAWLRATANALARTPVAGWATLRPLPFPEHMLLE